MKSDQSSTWSLVALARKVLRQHTILWVVGIIACLYAVSVLVYVQTVPDLGLRTLFGMSIKNYRSEEVLPGPEGLLPDPAQGDVVVQVGSKNIRTWPDLLNAPREMLRELAALKKGNLARPNPADPDHHLIKVVFERPVPEGEPQRFSAWVPLDHVPAEELAPALLWFSLKLLLFVVGVLVLWKRPNDPAAVQFFILCIVTLGAYIGGYHWIHIATEPPLLVGFIVCAVLLPPVTLHFYLVFPRPKEVLARHRPWVLLAVYGMSLVLLAALLTQYVHLRILNHSATSPEVMDAALNAVVWTCYVSLVWAMVLYLMSVVALLHSYFRAGDAMERNQVKCILGGTLVSLVPIGVSLYLAIFDPNRFGAGWATWPMFAASVCVTAAFVVGMTRYRLMELDQIISSGVVYFLISFLTGLGYYGVVFLGTLVFNQVIASPPLTDALKVSTVALVLMLLLDLARSRFQKALDRRFHREKYHLDRTLQRMGEAVQQLVDPPTLVQRLLHASCDLLGAGRGAVYLRQGEPTSYRLAGWVGPAPSQVDAAATDALPAALQRTVSVLAPARESGQTTAAQRHLRALAGELAYGLSQDGRLLAFLVLGPKASGPYRQEDLNLLGALAQITALALGSAEGHQMIEQLNRELQAKVEKIAEQQRRILALQSQLRRQGLLRTAARPDDGATGDSADGQRPAAAEVATAATPEAGFCENIIGSGVQVRQLLQMIRKVARTDAVVLIRGESGTGKELLAEAIHQNSARAERAFVKVHCAALSPTLLESELFGHVKGAFTGAHRDKVGRFELANGGTLFLDEIGDISLEVQTKLLRVLQERTFERVGSSESVKVDVRIIAATHQNLEELIRLGRFRDDLYYRLNVFPVTVPPLRQRREDIPELTVHFLQLAAKRCGKAPLLIDDEAMAALKAFDWPGNIRQLENVIERTVVLVEGSTIHLGDLPEEVRSAWLHPGQQSALAVNGTALPPPGLRKATLTAEDIEELERDRIFQALAAAGGNKAQAARELGMARSTLVSRLKKYGVL